MPQNHHSLLNPVGIVAKIPTGPMTRGEQTMIGIAHIDLSLAPEGTELFVQPSEGRLKLEIEVANDNALKWQDALKEQVARSTRLRCDLDKARTLLRRAASFTLYPDLQRDIDALLRE